MMAFRIKREGLFFPQTCVLTNRLENRVRDHNVTRSICGTIEQRRLVVTEAVCSHHSHLCPVSEEHVVFKHSDSKRMRRLGCSFKNYFPGEEQPWNVYPRQAVHAFLFQATGQMFGRHPHLSKPW